MSLSGALHNAFTGLTANARAAGLVSTNIANATTEGYGRRTLALSPAAAGTTGGVRVDSVVRSENRILLADRWQSDASLGRAADILTFNERLETIAGSSDSPGSLVGRISAFENALITASTNPSATQRLETVATTADSLADKLNQLSVEVQRAREDADSTIARQVDTLNDTLARLDQINYAVVRSGSTDGDVASLLDERQRLVDSISEIVPVLVVERDRGEISVFTTAGGILLDGRPAEIGFNRSNSIAPGMTLAGGGLRVLP